MLKNKNSVKRGSLMLGDSRWFHNLSWWLIQHSVLSPWMKGLHVLDKQHSANSRHCCCEFHYLIVNKAQYFTNHQKKKKPISEQTRK